MTTRVLVHIPLNLIGPYHCASPDKGNWKDDMKLGYGEQTFVDGGVFKGKWKDSKYHGKGSWTSANGEGYSGTYKNGVKHGQVNLAMAPLLHCSVLLPQFFFMKPCYCSIFCAS